MAQVTEEHRAKARQILELTREPPKRGKLARALRAVLDLAGPSTMERKRAAARGQALPARNGGGGRFPITDEASLRKAIRAVGRATDASGQHTEVERARVRAFIKRRAAALGLSRLIPDTWT
jgi:hypothetical protein